MHTRETIEQAIEAKVERINAEAKAEGFLPEEAPATGFNIYEAQFNMVERLINKRTNMRDNRRRSQILAGHSKIIQVINGYKF